MSKQRKRDRSVLPRSSNRSLNRIRKLVRTKISPANKTRRPPIRPLLERILARKRAYRRDRQIQMRKSALKPGTKVVEDMKTYALGKNDDDIMNEEDTESMDYEKLKNRLEIAHKKIRKLEEEGNNLKESKDQTMRTIENLLSQNRDLTSEIASLREQQRKDAKLIETLRKNLNIAESRMQKIKEENKILNENNLKALRELQAVGQEKSELNRSYRGQYEENKKLAQDRETVVAKLHALENRYAKMKSAFDEQGKTVASLKFELNKYRESISEMKDENTNLKNENLNLKNRIKLLEGAKPETVDSGSPTSNRRKKK